MDCNKVIGMKLFSCKLYFASVTFLLEIRIVLLNFGINGSFKEAKYIVFIQGFKIIFFYYKMNVINKFNVKDNKVMEFLGGFFNIFLYTCLNATLAAILKLLLKCSIFPTVL